MEQNNDCRLLHTDRIAMTTSSTEKTAPKPTPQPTSESIVTDLRVDAAHVDTGDALDVDLADAELETLPDWQRRQINQIVQSLRQRQIDLDAREASLNAQVAEFENRQRFEQVPSSTPPAPSDDVDRGRNSTLKRLEQRIQNWRKKWKGIDVSDEQPVPSDSVAVRLEKLVEAEAQLGQQWALLKNAQSLQKLREQEFAGYSQRAEKQLKESHSKQHETLRQDQSQIELQHIDLSRREQALIALQAELEESFTQLEKVRDQLETSWTELRVRIPSALRRKLDQLAYTSCEEYDAISGSRREQTQRELRELSNQLEGLKLAVQEEEVRLEDEFKRRSGELRRSQNELRDRESALRQQLAKLREEQEFLCDAKLEMLKKNYRDLTQSIVADMA